MASFQLFCTIFLSLFFLSSTAAASSLFERRTSNGRYVFDVLLEQGIPNEPLNLIFRMFDYNDGRIPNTDYAVLVDFTRSSTEKRLYLLNLRTAAVDRFYVAHGIRSGVLEARSFSNFIDSWKSSLGFYYAKGSYVSDKNGLSLYLDGLDRSNSNARNRTIVLHGASYVSDDFIAQNGRLGWSEGCLAVGLEHVGNLVSLLRNGSILFSYHKDLLPYSRRYPSEQSLAGDEIIPPGVNRGRNPGEGGGFDFSYINDQYILDNAGFDHHLK